MDIFNPTRSSAGTKQAAAPLEDGHPRKVVLGSTVVVGSACVVCSDFVSTVTIVWDLDVRGNWWNEQRANTNTGSLF